MKDQNVFKTFARVKCWAISPFNKDYCLIFSFSKHNFMITKQCNFYRLQRTQMLWIRQVKNWPGHLAVAVPTFSTFCITIRKWGTSASVRLIGTIVASRENEILTVWNFLQICVCVKIEKVCECLCLCLCVCVCVCECVERPWLLGKRSSWIVCEQIVLWRLICKNSVWYRRLNLHI
jgi:hypothetical protein